MPSDGKTHMPAGFETNGDVDPDDSELKDEREKSKAMLADEKAKTENYVTRLKYLQADFENYRKRMDKEFREIEDNALRVLVGNLLDGLDELQLAVENAEKAGQSDLHDGLKMVQRKMISSLETAGLSRIDCAGKPFDPALHEAVERVQGDSEEDTVEEEIRPGYMFRGKVLRPSMVKVELAQKRREATASE
jgi:molecular chaperone GrpE